MIRIHQLKLKTDHTEAHLKSELLKTLHVKEDALLSYRIEKQSLDARKKPNLFYVYTVDVSLAGEAKFIKKNRNRNIEVITPKEYVFPSGGEERLSCRPVIAGSGPAGLFCAYMLAEAGFAPILIERGMPVEQRKEDVETFWKTGVLDTVSNVQFGEGGAGTFSDGKLNTLVKDKFGRNRKVLEVFVKHGAPEDILYVHKPHIGTDILMKVVRNMRNSILTMGGEVHFHTQLTGIQQRDGRVQALELLDTRNGERSVLPAETLVLAIGHSARDTFEMLEKLGLPMEPKAFAVGVRVEHPQSMVNCAQYGQKAPEYLPAAAYKLTSSPSGERGVYTFCMCPGGYVVNASSEEGRLAVNGMSYHDRAGENANSAVIVTVTPEDYGGSGPLAGVAFQRKLEEKAYQLAGGKVPVQLFGDFCENKVSTTLGAVRPQIKGEWGFANVRSIFPEELAGALERGIKDFAGRLVGYDRKDAVLSGVESRTSSPVRMVRDKGLESSIKGLYPCGEGAGYAGGITSAAMDGIKVAEILAQKYRPFDKEDMV